MFKLAAIGSRVFLGLIFLGGGMSKLMPFPGVMGPVWLEEKLAPYDLDMYARFIAYSEAFIGLLLMTPRFTTVGAIMLVPLVLNILMVTISMSWQGTPYVVGGFLVLNLYLLLYDHRRLRPLLGMAAPPPAPSPSRPLQLGLDLGSLAGIGLFLAGPRVHALDPVGGYGTVIGGALLLLACGLAERRLRRG